jgi:hypothetical protein
MPSTSDDILKLEPILRALGEAVWAGANAEAARLNAEWASVMLDVRYSAHDGSFLHKVRMELADGTDVSPSLPMQVTLLLIELEKVRGAGDRQWYGLLLKITAAGDADARYDYNPNCADDEEFFDS